MLELQVKIWLEREPTNKQKKKSDSLDETCPQDIFNSEKTHIHFISKESLIQQHSIYTSVTYKKGIVPDYSGMQLITHRVL